MITRIGYSSLKGLPVKQPCYLATTSNIIDLINGAPDTLDGFSLNIGDRILVKDQSSGQENGIYEVVSVGSGSDGSWKRAGDSNIDDDFYQGLQVYVSNGLINGNKTFVLTSSNPIQLNVTGLTFSNYITSGEGGGFTPSNGLSEFSPGFIGLGGTISQDTEINAQTYDLTISDFGNLTLTGSNLDIQLDNGAVFIDTDTGTIDLYSGDILISSNNLDLSALDEFTLQFGTGSITSDDGKGLVYTDDYSPTFVSYSLVSKNYVDSGTASIWQAIDSINGDFITGVTAGSGLSGGGDQGFITIEINPSLAGTGLSYSTGSLNIVPGPGLTISDSSIKVNVGNGLSIENDTVFLGGTLSQNVVINSEGNDFTIQDFDNLTFTGSNVDIQLEDGLFIVDTGTGSIDLYSGDIIVYSENLDVTNLNEFNLQLSTASISTSNNKGLLYTEDYSGTFVSYSLISKGYVDAGTASIWSAIDSLGAGFTPSNGIDILSPGFIGLGGTLSQNTNLNANSNDLIIGNLNSLTITGSVVDIQLDNGSVFIDAGDLGNVDLYGGQIMLVATSSIDLATTGDFTITASASSITIANNKGLVYTQDYAATFVTQSLITKGYVDAAVSSLGPGFTPSNGLSEFSPGFVGLGGTLSQNTTIEGVGNNLTIGDVGYLFLTASVFDVESDFVSIDAGTGSMQLIANKDIDIVSTTGELTLAASSGEVGIGDLKGLVYASDYSGTFVTNSLVSKKYVDNLVSGGSSIKVVDYATGTTFSSVSTMIFRGGSINVPSGTANGVSVTGPTPVVTVWIPAPNYVGYFSPTLGTGTANRYVSSPSNNSYSGGFGNSGTYGVGTWNPSFDFSSNTTRSTINSSGTFSAFTETEFACFTTGTTMSFTLFNHDNSILYSINNYAISGAGSTTSNGLTITVNSFSADNDRYKANVSGTIAIGTIFPNGGRFKWNVTHYNGEGPGNAGVGVYSFTSTDIFYDNDVSPSSANISGGVDFNELTPVTVTYSGVAFYRTNTTFALTASGVNLLNDMTFPTTKQIDFSFTNLAITGTLDGYADGTKAAGSAITGWNINWNNSGLTFSRTATVSQASQYIPGFSTNNTINTSATSSVTSTIYDYVSVGSSQSVLRAILFDTYSPSSVTFANNPLDSEIGRLSVSGVTANGSAAFNSNLSLTSSNVDELQYIFGRVIYPQTNFTGFYPSVNFISNVDYSSLSGSNKTFDVYTDINSPTTTPVSINGYRWHVTAYGKDVSYSTSISNGIFVINSNFSESVLDYDGVNSISGSGDLVILIGIDDTSNNTSPNKFLFISANPSTYPGRQNSTTYNLNKAASSKDIQFTKGLISAVVRKVWLFVGYKNTAAGKNLNMTNISFS